jgi:hypothetical protein
VTESGEPESSPAELGGSSPSCEPSPQRVVPGTGALGEIEDGTESFEEIAADEIPA